MGYGFLNLILEFELEFELEFDKRQDGKLCLMTSHRITVSRHNEAKS